MLSPSRNPARWRVLARCTTQARHTARSSRRRPLTTLAIESSCDDTGVAILTRNHDGSPDSKCPTHSLLFNEFISSDHREFRGIEPMVAVKGHTSSLAPLLRRAIHHLPDATDVDLTSSEGSRSKKICWTEDGRPKKVPDFVSVTRGPGNMSNLSVGLNTAKGLAVAWDVPLVGVHHMQAHALTPRLVSALGMKPAADTGGGSSKRLPARGSRGANKQRQASNSSTSPEFPFLSLLVSGGHTQLVYSKSLTDHRIVASTLDVALGNLLDHAARDILPADVLATVPDVKYGRHLEAFAFPRGGTDEEYAFYPIPTARAYELASLDSGYEWFLPAPMAKDRKLAFSFSGLGSSASNIVAQISSTQHSPPSEEVEERRALARHTFAAAFRHLAGRIIIALEDRRDLRDHLPSTLVVAGGVACNRFLMHVLRETLAARGYGRMRIVVPPPALCTDNAAMIAWAGMEMYEGGWHTGLDVLAISKWPMDPDRGEGIMGAPGWLKR